MKFATLDEALRIIQPYIVWDYTPLLRPNHNPNDIQTRQCKKCDLFFVPEFRSDNYREMYVALCRDCIAGMVDSNDLKG